MATSVVFSILPISSSFRVWAKEGQTKPQLVQFRFDSSPGSNCSSLPCLSLRGSHEISAFHVVSCLSSSSSSETKVSVPSTRLYVSGLSFRTTEESLRAAFKNFGQLVEVNLVMDKIAKRPRGFAFLRYKTEEESQNAIEGMHGKFLDGRVIFVEVAKPRSELRQGYKQDNKKQYRTPLQQSLED